MINGSSFNSYVKLPEGLRSIPEDGLEHLRSRQICDPAMGHAMKFSAGKSTPSRWTLEYMCLVIWNNLDTIHVQYKVYYQYIL